MITIFFNFFIFLFIIYSHGLILLKNFFKNNSFPNFYEISIVGLIFTVPLSQFINFFFPLNNYIIISNILLLIIFFIFKKKFFFENLKVNFKIFLILFILIFINIYGSDFSEDLNHYHYGMIINADVSNYIWGNSFFHDHYGTSPTWLITHAYLNFDGSRLQDIHVLNGIFLFLFLGLFLSEFIKKNLNLSFKAILFSIFIFVLIKYSRLKEFGIDRPVILMFCFMIFIYFKYFTNYNDKDFINHFIIFSFISIVITSIKIIYLTILILPFLVFCKNWKKLLTINRGYFFIFLVTLIFLFKNILSSGCLLFPLKESCLAFLSWSNYEGAKDISFLAEYFNKSWTSYNGNLSKLEYIKNFNWFNTWFARGKIEILELFLTVLLVLVLCIFSFGFKKNNLKTEDIDKSFLINVLFLIIVSSVVIYFFKNPVIRMNHHVLISMLIILVLKFVNYEVNLNKWKIVNSILVIAFCFNIYKNIDRIKDNSFINDPIQILSEKIYDPKRHIIDNFTYFVGWYGNAPIGYKILENKKYKKKLIFNIISNK